jgi:hypothetical protein
VCVCGGKAWVVRRDAASSARVRARRCVYVCMGVCMYE